MTTSKRREENRNKIRKQAQNPHGPIKSLSKLADEYEAQQRGQ